MARYVFITGGVVSSLGKGLASAALGALLQARGYSVRLRKLDPYLNVDPGTMSPFEHGEVFVTDDGAETDLDLGHYERFTGVAARRTDSVSAGRIYSNVLEKERRGDYLGKTIQVIPHVTNEIKAFLDIGADEVDFMLCEIGGTVGDIEGLPFFEAIRQYGQDKPRGMCIYMHLTLLPFIAASGELKTKPTQHSVKELRAIGIAPDVLVCRSEMPIPQKERDKLALWYASANRDESVFPDGDRIIVDRENARRHLAFGYGIHRCVGARVAELQLTTLISEMQKRRLRVNVLDEPERVNASFVHGYRHMRVELERY